MYLNRELSWLEFNERVLHLASRTESPLLERLKFLAISASNLDEFYQVRIGGLTLLAQAGNRSTDICGLTASDQLDLILPRVSAMVARQYQIYNEQLLPLLTEQDLQPTQISSLSEEELAELEQYFLHHIAPALTLLALGDHPHTPLPSLKLIVGLGLASRAEPSPSEESQSRFVAIVLPEGLPRRQQLPLSQHKGSMLLEDLVLHFAPLLVPSEKVLYSSVFRLTRNGDIILEDEDGDMAEEMSEVLIARKFSDCIRLELPANTPILFRHHIARTLNAREETISLVHGPLRLNDFMSMAFESGNDAHKAPVWKAAVPQGVDAHISMFENIVQGDILINNPFESYEPVIRLIEEAARDPHVIAIKQVLYRTAKDSRFIAALCRAAEAGKQVTVLIELKARFDEQNNLTQAERLQRAGVQVVYGVKGYKTHAKILLIVRREGGQLRRYCHFGTGNYNESTARAYVDLSLLTCNDKLGSDASQFFNTVTGLTQLTGFRRIYPSPDMMKKRIIELIDAETARARLGEYAEIKAKMNALNEKAVMDALERAAEAGVQIRLNIRGICCWVPSSLRARSNTRIISILDFYLEHARILSFHNGGHPLTYITSADWMSRNLNKRVELMIPLEDPALAQRARDILDTCLRDNTNSFLLMDDGSYTPTAELHTELPSRPLRMQEQLQRRAEEHALTQEHRAHHTLTPHLPTAAASTPSES